MLFCNVLQTSTSSKINLKSFDDETDYVIGFSKAINETTMASRFQKIDFFLLLAAARAMVNNKSPWACTGQNQAYRKSLLAWF